MDKVPPAEFISTYEEESFVSSVVRVLTHKPTVTLGFTGMVGALGYGYWRYKNKGVLISPSLFLMQLRVGAQSTVIGVIMIGMLCNLYEKQFGKKKTEN